MSPEPKNPVLLEQATNLLGELFSRLQIKITTNHNEEGVTYNLTFPELEKTFIFDKATGKYLGAINYIAPSNLPMTIPNIQNSPGHMIQQLMGGLLGGPRQMVMVRRNEEDDSDFMEQMLSKFK